MQHWEIAIGWNRWNLGIGFGMFPKAKNKTQTMRKLADTIGWSEVAGVMGRVAQGGWGILESPVPQQFDDDGYLFHMLKKTINM